MTHARFAKSLVLNRLQKGLLEIKMKIKDFFKGPYEEFDKYNVRNWDTYYYLSQSKLPTVMF